MNSINIRNLSVKCGRCGEYQVLIGFGRRADWNVYTFECEGGDCQPEETRTLLEVPRQLDEFARRDPTWSSAGGATVGDEDPES